MQIVTSTVRVKQLCEVRILESLQGPRYLLAPPSDIYNVSRTKGLCLRVHQTYACSKNANGQTGENEIVNVLHCSSAIISSVMGSCRLCAACLFNNAVDVAQSPHHNDSDTSELLF